MGKSITEIRKQDKLFFSGLKVPIPVPSSLCLVHLFVRVIAGKLSYCLHHVTLGLILLVFFSLCLFV